MERIRSRCASSWVPYLVLVAVVALLVAPASAAAVVGGEIGGTVTDSVTGDPLSGIGVQVFGPLPSMEQPKPGKTTDVLGEFVFTGLDPGDYQVVYTDATKVYPETWYPGRPTNIFGDHVTVGSGAVSAHIALSKGTTVTVNVKRAMASPADPVEGVYVTLYFRNPTTPGTDDWSYPVQILTDAAGNAVFPCLFPGQWRALIEDTRTVEFRAYEDTYDPSSTTFRTVGAGVADYSWAIAARMYAIAHVAPDNGEGWQKDPGGGVRVTFSKDEGDLGPSDLFYQFIIPGFAPTDAGNVASVSEFVANEGEWQVTAYTRLISNDAIVGPYETKYLRIDNTAPHSIGNADGGNHPFVMSADDVAVPGVNAHSDVAHMYYSDDGAAPVEYTAPVTLPIGLHAVSYWAVDGAGNVEPAHSGTIISGPQPGVSKPVGASSVRKNRYATYRGTLSARVKNRSHLVLRAYRFNGVDWVLTRTKTVHITTPRRGKARYSGSIKFTAKGSWKVVAYFTGNSTWAPAWSSPRYVTVR
jgi:hypothetical protein